MLGVEGLKILIFMKAVILVDDESSVGIEIFEDIFVGFVDFLIFMVVFDNIIIGGDVGVSRGFGCARFLDDGFGHFGVGIGESWGFVVERDVVFDPVVGISNEVLIDVRLGNVHRLHKLFGRRQLGRHGFMRWKVGLGNVFLRIRTVGIEELLVQSRMGFDVLEDFGYLIIRQSDGGFGRCFTIVNAIGFLEFGFLTTFLGIFRLARLELIFRWGGRMTVTSRRSYHVRTAEIGLHLRLINANGTLVCTSVVTLVDKTRISRS